MWTHFKRASTMRAKHLPYSLLSPWFSTSELEKLRGSIFTEMASEVLRLYLHKLPVSVTVNDNFSVCWDDQRRTGSSPLHKLLMIWWSVIIRIAAHFIFLNRHLHSYIENKLKAASWLGEYYCSLATLYNNIDNYLLYTVFVVNP